MKTLKVSRKREIVDMNAVYEDVGRDLQLLAVELEDCNPSLLLSTALYYRCRGVSPEAIVERWWGQITAGSTFLKDRRKTDDKPHQVSNRHWSDICEELVTLVSNASQSDLGVLMAMCAMYIVDPNNVIVIPPHLERCGKLINLVREDSLALTNISGMLAFYVQQQQTMQ